MRQRIILISVAGILLLLLGVGVWFYFSPDRSARDLLPPVFSIPGDEEFEPGDVGQPGIDERDEEEGGAPPALRKIADEPVSGFTTIEKEIVVGVEPAESSEEEDTPIVGTTTAIRYMEKETGHVYEYIPQNNATNRLTNTTIPRSHEVFFNSEGDRVIVRYLNNQQQIETFAGSIQTATGTREGVITGSFLDRNITAITPNPSGDRIFYLVGLDSGVVGRISNFDGSEQSTVFQFPFTQWLVDWNKENAILLTTKPSGQAPGYVYKLNPDTGDFSRVIGEREGLTVLGNTVNDLLLLGTSPRNTIGLFAFSQETNQMVSLPVRTLPEKCVWRNNETSALCGVPLQPPAAIYPDEWYQGIVSFSDGLWRIDTEIGNARVVEENPPEELDVIKPELSANEDVLVFINKRDNSLWLLETGF